MVCANRESRKQNKSGDCRAAGPESRQTFPHTTIDLQRLLRILLKGGRPVAFREKDTGTVQHSTAEEGGERGGKVRLAGDVGVAVKVIIT